MAKFMKAISDLTALLIHDRKSEQQSEGRLAHANATCMTAHLPFGKVKSHILTTQNPCTHLLLSGVRLFFLLPFHAFRRQIQPLLVSVLIQDLMLGCTAQTESLTSPTSGAGRSLMLCDQHQETCV